MNHNILFIILIVLTTLCSSEEPEEPQPDEETTPEVEGFTEGEVEPKEEGATEEKGDKEKGDDSASNNTTEGEVETSPDPIVPANMSNIRDRSFLRYLKTSTMRYPLIPFPPWHPFCVMHPFNPVCRTMP